MIVTIARYSLREALGNRLAAVMAVLLLATFLLTEFVGAVALTEHRAVQAALAGAALRIEAVGVIALFVVTSALREQQDRGLDLLLALPHPRAHYVLGKLLAHAAIAVVLAAACGVVALLYAPTGAALGWAASLACEAWIVAAFGLWLAFTFRQPVVALAALAATYVLARAMAALLLIQAAPTPGAGGWGNAVIGAVLGALDWVLPSLHRYTQAGWLAHGGAGWSELGLVAGQTLVYLPLLAAAAAFDLYRRDA